jgi:NADH-quinone oxidoreductase subunit M
MIALSLIAVIYVGLVAMVQQDMKKLVAYSSVAHMGFVTLGFFIFNDLGVAGGLVQMIAHGFVSGAMFLCIGVLYDRVHSREIAATAAWSTPCPSLPPLPCCSSWPTAACRHGRALWASGW